MFFPVADAHCDFLYYMAREGYDMHYPHPAQMISADTLIAGNVKLQFFAAWIDPDLKMPPLQQTMNMIDAYYKMLETSPNIIPFTLDFEEKNGGVTASVLTIEGGEALQGSLENLRIFYRLGVRAMTLTWNATNELAYPAMRKGGRGLTKLGMSVVREMDALGMALDVSHLNEQGIDDALSIYNRPIMASHSNARRVHEHRRSLSDEHISAIAKRDGFIGVNYYPPQLTNDPLAACVSDVADHIEHIASVGGIACVGLGSDFDGMTVLPVDIKSPADVPKLFDELKQRGFSDSDIKRISYDNLREYISKFY